MPLKGFLWAGLVTIGTGITAAVVFWKGPSTALFVALIWFCILKLLNILFRRLP